MFAHECQPISLVLLSLASQLRLFVYLQLTTKPLCQNSSEMLHYVECSPLGLAQSHCWNKQKYMDCFNIQLNI